MENEFKTSGWSKEDSIKLAIIEFKDLHWKPIECCKCDVTEGVKNVEIWSDPYCETCLEKALREDEDDLFDSISEPDVEY